MLNTIASTMSRITVETITSMIVKPASSSRDAPRRRRTVNTTPTPLTQTLKVFTTVVALLFVTSHTVNVCRPIAQLFEPADAIVSL